MENLHSKQAQNGRENHSDLTVKSDVAQGLRTLFVDELKDIYWAENALIKAIPMMAEEATSETLVEALTKHQEVTKEHIVRLESIFSLLKEKAEAKKCDAMEGLIKETNHIIQKTAKGTVRDAGIISAGQKIEHYEIATYGTLASFARTLQEKEVADLLQKTLKEEKEADKSLSEIAELSVNKNAATDTHKTK